MKASLPGTRGNVLSRPPHRRNMITKTNREKERFEKITLSKYVDEVCATNEGAFREGKNVTFALTMPREIGASGVVMRLAKDGEEPKDIPFEIVEMGLSEEYGLCLSLPVGLYFYEILILRGLETLFSNTENNLDISFSYKEGNKFTLLVFDKDYEAPKGYSGGVMYHIFVDRFKKNETVSLPRRADAEYEEDWYDGKLQYAEIRGGEVKNNRFFGGDLFGICEKLDYLKSLGVTVIYLSPIFEAYSNHKYDTGDYMKVDAGFGGDEALEKLIAEAHEKGIKIILDGVFNHTGDDSLYFNKKGKYPSVGAYSGKSSPYYDWFNFTERTDGSIGYESWWGIEIMPRLNQRKAECRDYFCGNGGVCEKYMRMGVDGFRLDVADELPDSFLYDFRTKMRGETPGSMLIGEVWENAVTKISYSERRRYFEGKQLDSVMNYPFRTALIDAFRYSECEMLADTLKLIYSTYPREISDNLMNIVGTHDTERILSILGGADGDGMTNAEADAFKLKKKDRADGIKRLMAASAVQYTVYGFPSLYYGDEAGMEGLFDPFNRRAYPWGKEDGRLLEHYRKLGKIREDEAFLGGEFEIKYANEALLIYKRKGNSSSVTVAVNFSSEEVMLPHTVYGKDMMTGRYAEVLSLPAYGFKIIKKK